jgi:hypothetical protein
MINRRQFLKTLGAGLSACLGGCKTFSLGKKVEETYYSDPLVHNTVPYEISTGAEAPLRAVEDLYLHENPKFKGMTKLPDSEKVAIRVAADKMGKRDRRISEAEAKDFHYKIVSEYERTLSLPRFEPEIEKE